MSFGASFGGNFDEQIGALLGAGYDEHFGEYFGGYFDGSFGECFDAMGIYFGSDLNYNGLVDYDYVNSVNYDQESLNFVNLVDGDLRSGSIAVGIDFSACLDSLECLVLSDCKPRLIVYKNCCADCHYFECRCFEI